MGHSLNKEELILVQKELVDIKSKNYDISDVSLLMKKLVNEEYGDEDWSTSGYWVRADQYFKEKYYNISFNIP